MTIRLGDPFGPMCLLEKLCSSRPLLLFTKPRRVEQDAADLGASSVVG